MSLPKETMKILETLIPELRESEDEKIRKWIYNLVSDLDPQDDDAEKELDEMKPLVLAWLEKQKEASKAMEQKPGDNEKVEMTDFEQSVYDLCPVLGIEEAKATASDLLELAKKTLLKTGKVVLASNYPEGCSFEDGFHLGYSEGFNAKQKEQKPAEIAPNQFDGITYGMQGYSTEKPMEWSEDWREEDIQTRFAFYTYKDEDGVLYLSNVFVEEASRNHGFGTKILAAAEKVAETIGATTISLKVKQDSPANAWYRKNGYGYVTFEDGYDWLEKNLEYMKPNKQEWSEEDTEMYINVASSLRGYACGLKNKEHRKHIKKGLDWLENRFKSLCPQLKEEWSEEDERILKGIIGLIDHDQHYDVSNKEMLDWLKSLRPSWKPSVEQMNTLLSVEGILRSLQYSDKAKILASIYEQLKQLYL